MELYDDLFNMRRQFYEESKAKAQSEKIVPLCSNCRKLFICGNVRPYVYQCSEFEEVVKEER